MVSLSVYNQLGQKCGRQELLVLYLTVRLMSITWKDCTGKCGNTVLTGVHRTISLASTSVISTYR